MTTLAIILILLGLTGYGLKEYYQVKLGKPTPTPPAVIAELTEFLTQYAPAGRLLDMGAGWGNLVLALAKNLPDWQVDGIEASPTPWFIANCRTIGRNNSNYRFFIGRMEDRPLQGYDVIFLHQPMRNIMPMLKRLGRALQNDTYIITYPHPLPRLPDPDLLVSENNDTLYLYRGLGALTFLNEPLVQTPDIQPEPAQEPVDTPANHIDPTDDNQFAQQPNDSAAPGETAPSSDPVTPASVGDAPPADLPPATDFPEQPVAAQEQYRLPLNQTD